MRVIVTGGAGFIGANLVRRMQTSPLITDIVVLDDFSTGAASNLVGVDEKVTVIEGSILDAELVDSLMPGTAAIVHLAARPSVPRSIADPMASHRVNVDGTMNILEAARAQVDKPQIVFASSSSVYGSNPALPKHEDLATRPLSPYAASKLTAEAYVLAYQESFGIPALPFRFFNVFGPLQAPGHAYAAVVPAFTYAALRSEPAVIHGDGLQTRDFTFVGTVTEVITDAVTRTVTSTSPVNLAFGTRSSLLDVLSLLEDITGQAIAREHVERRRGDVRDSQAANDRLLALFPDVQPVELRAGLDQTVAWMRSIVTQDSQGALAR